PSRLGCLFLRITTGTTTQLTLVSCFAATAGRPSSATASLRPESSRPNGLHTLDQAQIDVTTTAGLPQHKPKNEADANLVIGGELDHKPPPDPVQFEEQPAPDDK